MRALVTGGAGLIGSHLVDLLLEQGWEVRILDSLDPTTHPNGDVPEWSLAVLDDVPFYQRDVRDPDGVAAACEDVDVVFHQAAFGGFSPFARQTADANAVGTATVMDAARHAGVSKVVVASSQAVYGNGQYVCNEPQGACGWNTEDDGLALRPLAQLEAGRWEVECPVCHGPASPLLLCERHPVDLPSIYALSKFFTERAALLLGEQWGLPVVALRYALTYGPRQSVSNPYTGVASMFSTRMLAGQAPTIYEDGRQTRDFTYVADVAAANLLAATDARADGRALNVGTGERTTVLEFAGLLRDALYGQYGEVSRIKTYTGPVEACGRYRPADARHTAVDGSHLRHLGWAPTVAVRRGASRYVEWFLASGGGAPVDADAELAAAGIVRG